MMKAIYVAATGQNVGKSTSSIGLLHLFQSYGLRTGFIKPVGQTYIDIDEIKVDKDALLMKLIFDLPDELPAMSPVCIPSGFTSEFLRNRQGYAHLKDSIAGAFETICKDKDVVVVEGTGHAGVGSVVGLSNATVAKILGIPVILVAQGGIGSSIDELVLNAALFQKEGVEILGVLVNKVMEEKYARVRELVSGDLTYRGFDPLGFLPFRPSLSMPHVYQVCRRVGADIIYGEDEMTEYVENVAIAAMAPQNFIGRLSHGSLVIVPGDRVDNIVVAISFHLLGRQQRSRIAGILLTGGLRPDPSILELVQKSRIPLLISKEDTYAVASKVVSMTVKTQSTDLAKIETIQALYREYVDMDSLRRKLGI
jgi:BioD-like phosphotransacetylase family protein